MPNNYQEFDEEEAADRLQQEQQKSREGLKETVVEAVTAPIKMGAARLLQSAWLSLTSVIGFVFIGLPYINAHVFMHFLLPSVFCNLGEEWTPKGVRQLAGKIKTGGTPITLVEWMLFITLDILVFVAIILIFIIFLMIIDFVTGLIGFFTSVASPLEAVHDVVPPTKQE